MPNVADTIPSPPPAPPVNIPPAWSAVRDDFETAFPELSPDVIRQEYEQHRNSARLEHARQFYRSGEGAQSLESPDTWIMRRSMPVTSSVINFGTTVTAERARARIARGAPEPLDFYTVARAERLQELDAEQNSTTSGAVGSAAAHIPAMAGEAFLGGAALRAAGVAAPAAAAAPSLFTRGGMSAAAAQLRGLATREGAAAVAQAAPGYLGRTAAQTALMPSMWLPEWAENNVQSGRDPLDWRGAPPAFGLGMAQTAVLGSLGRVGNSIPGRGVGGTIGRLAVRTATGMAEQQGIDILASATQNSVEHVFGYSLGLPTNYGILGELILGHGDEAMQHAIVQAATFAVFSGMHEAQERPGPHPVMEAARDTMNALHEQRVPIERAGERMVEVADTLGAAITRNDQLTREQARAIIEERFPAGPLREYGLRLAETIPEQQPAQGPRPGQEATPERPQAPPANAPEGPVAVQPEARSAPGGPPEQPASAPAAPKPLPVEQIKEMAKTLGLSTKGTPEEMVDRIRKAGGGPFLDQFLNPEPPKAEPNANSNSLLEPAQGPSPPGPPVPEPKAVHPLAELWDRAQRGEPVTADDIAQRAGLTDTQSRVFRKVLLEGPDFATIDKERGWSRGTARRTFMKAAEQASIPEALMMQVLAGEKTANLAGLRELSQGTAGEGLHEEGGTHTAPEPPKVQKLLDLADQLLKEAERGRLSPERLAHFEQESARVNSGDRGARAQENPADALPGGARPDSAPDPNNPPDSGNAPGPGAQPAPGVGAPPAESGQGAPPTASALTPIQQAQLARTKDPFTRENLRLRFEGNVTLVDHIRAEGGIDPRSFRDPAEVEHWAGTFGKQIFKDSSGKRRGKMPLDELMDGLWNQGRRQNSEIGDTLVRPPPPGADPQQHLFELLKSHFLIDGNNEAHYAAEQIAHLEAQAREEIAARNPSWSEKQIERELAQIVAHGEEVGSRESGNEPPGESISEERGGHGGGDDLSDIPFKHRQPRPGVTPDLAGFERDRGFFPEPVSGAERRTGAVGTMGMKDIPKGETALANVVTDKERHLRKVAEIVDRTRLANETVWNQALEAIRKDPSIVESTISDLEQRPRPASVEEDGILLQRRIALTNEHDRAFIALANAREQAEFLRKGQYYGKNPEKVVADEALAVANERAINEQLDRLDRVIVATGTEQGRALQFRAQMVKLDYSISGMMRSLEAAKGKPLSEAEKKMVTEYQSKIEELQKKLNEAEKSGRAEPGKPSDADFELARMIGEWRDKVTETKEGAAPWHVKAVKGTLDAINIPRSLMSSIDFPLLRQGLIATVTHPVSTAKAVPEMFRSFFSERVAERAQYEILHRPNAPFYKLAGLEITGGHALTAHEEGFISRFINKVPVVGHVTRASERSYQTILNRIRADVFDSMAENLSRNGRMTGAEGKVIANYVNVMTGRGSLGSAERAASLLNQVFFAPKWTVSRFQYLLGQPLISNFSQNAPRARVLVAKEYGKMVFGMGLVIGAAALAGFDLEKDPRSSDFGKLKIGNTRLDVAGGLSSVLRLFAQTATLSTKGPTGRVHSLHFDPANPDASPRYGESDYADVLRNFVRGKFAPAPGTAVDLLSGRDVVHNPVTPRTAAIHLVEPLFERDVRDAVVDLGVPRGTAVSLLGLLGMGMQTYNSERRLRGLR